MNLFDFVPPPLGGMVSSCTRDFNTELELQELETFYTTNLNELGTAKRATETAISKTKSNIKWMESYYEQIVTWLGDNTTL